MVCGNNAPPGVCYVYYSNAQTQEGGTRRRRALLDNSNCPGCLELCNCQNVGVILVSACLVGYDIALSIRCL